MVSTIVATVLKIKGQHAEKLYSKRGEQTGQNLDIDPLRVRIYHSESDEKYISKGEAWRPVNAFIVGGSDGTFCDETDNNDKFLFARALKKFGALQYNEMYTFAPPPFTCKLKYM